MNPVDTIRFEGGLTAALHHDADAAQPFRDDDAVRIVVLHRRYIDPSHGACGKDPEEVAAWEAKNAAEWFSIPLFLYDHSGTIYCAGHSNPFHCPWDSGRVGIIALKRAEWGNGEESDAKLTAYAESIAAEYTAWANGECYGYVLCDEAGRETGCCWGFIGIESVREEAAAAANAISRVRGNGAPTKVWLVHISHRHGDNYAAFATLVAAQDHLHAYVADWWDEGLTDQYGALATLSREEAIEAYFDAHDNALDFEFYALEEVSLDAGES